MSGDHVVDMGTPVGFVATEYYITEPWYLVYPFNLPWVNRSGGDTLLVEFKAIIIPVSGQSLAFEVYKCNRWYCELLVSDKPINRTDRVG